MKMQLIDNGFFLISASDALRLAGSLPRHGYQKLVSHEGRHYWLQRTPYFGKLRWAIFETNWRLVGEKAVL